MRTKLKGLLIGMMVFVMMFAGTLVVQAASGTVTFGSNSYTKKEGEEFNVGVYVKSSDADIATYKFYINYDADKVEYVSGADSGGSGRLSFAGTMSNDSRRYKKIWLTFKAKTAGEFTMSVTDVYLGPLDVANGDSMTVSKAGSAPITIKAAGTASGDCDLKSISIAETGFYGFSASKTEYDITVENKHEKLTVTAKPADSNATVEISDTNLKVGTNYIKIKVTAPSGDSKTYTVIVRRKAGTAGETTTPTETTTPVEPPTIPGVDELKSYYSYNGTDLYFTENLDGVTIPEGYTKVKVTIENKEYEVLTNSNGTIVLYYLADISGQNAGLYVYSSSKNAVYPYVVLTNSTYSYMVDEIDNPNVPEGYQKVNMVIKGAGGSESEVSVIAWYHEDAPNFYLLYASCNGEDPTLYQYDVKENTIQRYNGVKGSTQIVEGSGDTEKVKDLEKKVEKLEKEKKSEAKTWMLVVIVLAVLCIVLVVIVVALFYKMRDQMEYESYDDDDNDDNGYSDDDDRMITAPKTEKKNVKNDYDDDDDDFTFFDMDDDK